jgi:RNA polymerase sigma-70 factor (ECF subfamily)
MKSPTAAEGMPERVEAWLATHRHELMRAAMAILRDRDEAEDVVQETLLRVWRRAARHEIQEAGAYLARAVYWNALKRRARRRRELSLDEAGGHGREPVAGKEPTWTLEPFELERAVADLPVSQQVVIRLRFYLGLSFREIGTALSISANTAASRSRYAIRALRQRLLDRK